MGQANSGSQESCPQDSDTRMSLKLVGAAGSCGQLSIGWPWRKVGIHYLFIRATKETKKEFLGI